MKSSSEPGLNLDLIRSNHTLKTNLIQVGDFFENKGNFGHSFTNWKSNFFLLTFMLQINNTNLKGTSLLGFGVGHEAPRVSKFGTGLVEGGGGGVSQKQKATCSRHLKLELTAPPTGQAPNTTCPGPECTSDRTHRGHRTSLSPQSVRMTRGTRVWG